MFNTFKNKTSKISKSSSRLSNFTPKSNSSATEAFDSTSQVSQKSGNTPSKDSSAAHKSSSRDPPTQAQEPKAAPIYPAPSEVIPPSKSLEQSSSESPVLNQPTASLVREFAKPKPRVLSPKRASSPKPEKVQQDSTISSGQHFGFRNKLKPSSRESSSATASNINIEPKPDLTKTSLPEPKTMAPAKPKTSAKAPAKQLIVGSGVNVHADITEADVVVIEGTVDGTISADCLNILDGGIFNGEATCRVAFISGVFIGPELITSEKLEVGSTGKITASITYNVISMEAGSVVTGMLTHKPPPEPEPEPVPEVKSEDLPTVKEGDEGKKDDVKKSPEKKPEEKKEGEDKPKETETAKPTDDAPVPPLS